MTALAEFEKIEAIGLWRDGAEAQRRDVIVTLGDASLTILDMQNRVLAHWSIPAVARANPGQMPAIYHPDGIPDETLELPEDSDVMVEAIEKLRSAVEKRRPRPGRLRLTSALFIFGAISALGVFWLPGAVINQTLSVLPEIKQREIGALLQDSARRFTGNACQNAVADVALAKLARRVSPETRIDLTIVPDGLPDVLALPGHHYVVGRPLVEDYETPEVLIGFLLAEKRRFSDDVMRDLLEHSDFFDNVRLLTSGSLPPERIESYAEEVLTRPRAVLSDSSLLNDFAAINVSSRPYAYALDVTGETTLDLIEADPTAVTNPPPVLTDGEWVALQAICES